MRIANKKYVQVFYLLCMLSVGIDSIAKANVMLFGYFCYQTAFLLVILQVFSGVVDGLMDFARSNIVEGRFSSIELRLKNVERKKK